MSKSVRAVAAAFCVLALQVGRAGQGLEAAVPSASSSAEENFEQGRFEAAFNNGVLFSPMFDPKNRPTINYTLTELQLGYMLSDLGGPGLLRGNFELSLDGFGGWIFDGPGSFIAGATFWGRYNFVQPSARLVPYLQLGLGLTSTDIDRRIVGQPFNFNLDVGAGVRYFLSRRWAVSLEYRYQHISNAGTGPHNIGINSYGPMLGVSYLF